MPYSNVANRSTLILNTPCQWLGGSPDPSLLCPIQTGHPGRNAGDEPIDKAELSKILDAVSVNSPVEDFVATDLEFHRRIAQEVITNKDADLAASWAMVHISYG